MVIHELEHEAVGGQVGQAVHGVGGEVVVLALLTVGDDGRAGGLEPGNSVVHGRLVEGVELLPAHLPGCAGGHGANQVGRPRDAADRFGWNGCRHGVLRRIHWVVKSQKNGLCADQYPYFTGNKETYFTRRGGRRLCRRTVSAGG